MGRHRQGWRELPLCTFERKVRKKNKKEKEKKERKRNEEKKKR